MFHAHGGKLLEFGNGEKLVKCPKIGGEGLMVVVWWADSANASSGQCALGAPLLKGEKIVRCESDGFNIMSDSGESGWRRI